MNFRPTIRDWHGNSAVLSHRNNYVMEADSAFDYFTVLVLLSISMHDAQGALIALAAYGLVLSARLGIDRLND